MFWLMIDEKLTKDELEDIRKVLLKVRKRTGKWSWKYQNTEKTPRSVYRSFERGEELRDHQEAVPVKRG